MATLETQYKNYQNENPESSLTFEEWKKNFGSRMGNRISEILKKINTPEYKQKRIEENKKYLDNLTVDFQLGKYVGEYIFYKYLPTLSTDMLQTRHVIKVSEEDEIENKRLGDEWLATSDHNKLNNEGDKEKWELYRQHNKMLEKKYLPNPLVCYLSLLKFNDEVEFKKGIYFTMWDCDMCSYDIKPENVKIEYDLEHGHTIITFKHDVDNDVEIEYNENMKDLDS